MVVACGTLHQERTAAIVRGCRFPESKIPQISYALHLAEPCVVRRGSAMRHQSRQHRTRSESITSRKETSMLRVWRFATIYLTAITLALTFCHLLEMPRKMQYGEA